MWLVKRSGRVHGRSVDWCRSPNFDDRPDPKDISLVVVHNISLPPGEFGGPHIDQLFCNRLERHEHPYFDSIADLRVSAHVLIRRDGHIRQYVPFHKRAWHAGVSSWAGRDRCNDFSIGIELEGTDDRAYEACQYASLARLLGLLLRVYPGIERSHIVGHSDVAPGRKTDPGPAMDWERLFSNLKKRKFQPQLVKKT